MKFGFGGETRRPKRSRGIYHLGGGLSIRLRGTTAIIIGSEGARPAQGPDLSECGVATAASAHREVKREQRED